SGVPTPMKPPIMTVAPLGIIATASSAETGFMLATPDLVCGRWPRGQLEAGVMPGFDLHQGPARAVRRGRRSGPFRSSSFAGKPTRKPHTARTATQATARGTGHFVS